MSTGRTILYFLGILLVVAALMVFFFQSGLNRWVPVGLLAAGVLLIIGLAVMSFADSAPVDRPVVEHRGDDRRVGRGEYDDKDVTVINNR
jgi:hypothetical protein